MKKFEQISYAKTVYGKEEIDAVTKCLSESTQMGNYSRKFEKKIAKLFDKKHCLYVNSGSSALYIGVESFEFRPLCFDLQPNFWNQFKEIKRQLSNWYSEIFQYIFCAYNCIHLELHLSIIFLKI